MDSIRQVIYKVNYFIFFYFNIRAVYFWRLQRYIYKKKLIDIDSYLVDYFSFEPEEIENKKAKNFWKDSYFANSIEFKNDILNSRITWDLIYKYERIIARQKLLLAKKVVIQDHEYFRQKFIEKAIQYIEDQRANMFLRLGFFAGQIGLYVIKASNDGCFEGWKSLIPSHIEIPENWCIDKVLIGDPFKIYEGKYSATSVINAIRELEHFFLSIECNKAMEHLKLEMEQNSNYNFEKLLKDQAKKEKSAKK